MPELRKPPKPRTHNGNLASLPAALQPLTQKPNWVGWRWEWRKDKYTKPPFQPRDPAMFAKADDAGTWGTYAAALVAYQSTKVEGIGYNDRDELGIVDLDDCIDPKTGKIDAWAQQEIDAAMGCYVEVTPSGRGLRILGISSGKELGRRWKVPNANGAGIEVYRKTNRYITITGLQIAGGNELSNIDAVLHDIIKRFDAKSERPNERSHKAKSSTEHNYNADIDELIKNGAPQGFRSELFSKVIWSLASGGKSPQDIYEILSAYPSGIGSKYGKRLGREIDRCFQKWKAHQSTPDNKSMTGVTLDDFSAYMPMHCYIYKPSCEMWPASSVNSKIPPVTVVDEKGNPILDDKGKSQSIPANAWIDKNASVEQMTWAPGLPMLITGRLISDGGWIKREGVTCFNLYRPPTLKHGIASEALPWIRHILKVFNKDDGRRIIRWLAHRVQRPQEKINHAMVLGGAQGIGKDTLLEPMKEAVGAWNFHEVSPKQISGRFNGFLKSVILRVNEARDLGDSNRYDFYDHMKAYTAAPPDVLRVDEKHLREYSVFNICGIIITTNYKSDGIYLPADDRRHYVAWSERTKDDFSKEYWDTLWRWYDQGGISHVAAYLATLDISDFKPKAPPAKTPAFWDIVDASRAPEDAELADAVDNLGNPNAVTIHQVANAAESEAAIWIRDRKNRRAIPHRLEAIGYVPVRNELAKDGLWVINGKRQTVYAKSILSVSGRLAAANRLTGGDERES
jgi:hypothetical protein